MTEGHTICFCIAEHINLKTLSIILITFSREQTLDSETSEMVGLIYHWKVIGGNLESGEQFHRSRESSYNDCTLSPVLLVRAI